MTYDMPWSAIEDVKKNVALKNVGKIMEKNVPTPRSSDLTFKQQILQINK